MADNRVKYAYLNYDDIQERIKNGDIDEYDIVFTKDTHEQYFLREDLSLVNIKARIYRFDSVAIAIEQLNLNTDTYEGQIVAIADNDLGVYHGYIVNKSGDKYTVLSIADSGTVIDYDTLSHQPIINKKGTLSDTLIVGNLDNGFYSVSGEYKIFEEHITSFSTSTEHLFAVEVKENVKYVKEISAEKITTYTLSDGVVSVQETVTTDFLDENGYMTEEEFDAKIVALDLINKTEVSDYVKKITTEYLNENIETKINEKIDLKIESMIASDSEIENLFGN